jgi:hypothetical protein
MMANLDNLYDEKLPNLATDRFETLLKVEKDPDKILPWWWQEVKHLLLVNTKYWPQWAFGRNESRKSFARQYWDWDFIHELTEEVLYHQLLKKRQLRIWILPEVENIEQLRARLWMVCRNVLSKHRQPTINSNIRRRMIAIFKSMGIDVGKDPILLSSRSFTPEQVAVMVKIAKRQQAEVEELFDLLAEKIVEDESGEGSKGSAPETDANNVESEFIEDAIESFDSLEEAEKGHIKVVADYFSGLEQHHESQEHKVSYLFDSADLVAVAVALAEAQAVVSVRILEHGVDSILKGIPGSLKSLKALYSPFDPVIRRKNDQGELQEENILTNVSTVESSEGMQRTGGSFPTYSGNPSKGISRAAHMSNQGLDELVDIKDPRVGKLARQMLSNLDIKEQKCFAMEFPGNEFNQVEKLEFIGGLPGKPFRQKYGNYAKALLQDTIPTLFKELPVEEDLQEAVVREMWVQLGVRDAK